MTGSSKALAKRQTTRILPARFELRLRIEPSELRACFEQQNDVIVGDRWPTDDDGKHWFLAKSMPGGGLRLRIAPERSAKPVRGLARQPLEIEVRLDVRAEGTGSVVDVSYALAPTPTLLAALIFPGIGLLLGGVALAGAWGVLLGLAAFLAIIWPRNLQYEAKDLRNKVSAALGPVLAQEDAEIIYR